jgi:hypothetical protein
MTAPCSRNCRRTVAHSHHTRSRSCLRCTDAARARSAHNVHRLVHSDRDRPARSTPHRMLAVRQRKARNAFHFDRTRSGTWSFRSPSDQPRISSRRPRRTEWARLLYTQRIRYLVARSHAGTSWSSRSDRRRSGATRPQHNRARPVRTMRIGMRFQQNAPFGQSTTHPPPHPICQGVRQTRSRVLQSRSCLRQPP